MISIHAPVKGATRRIQQAQEAVSYFNPRSREGSDTHIIGFDLSRIISIHAPVKGATDLRVESLLQLRISIHAPVKGATQYNTHLHILQAISIHAPVKGATS